MNTSFCGHILLETEWNNLNNLSFIITFSSHLVAFWNLLIYVGVGIIHVLYAGLLYTVFYTWAKILTNCKIKESAQIYKGVTFNIMLLFIRIDENFIQTHLY